MKVKVSYTDNEELLGDKTIPGFILQTLPPHKNVPLTPTQTRTAIVKAMSAGSWPPGMWREVYV